MGGNDLKPVPIFRDGGLPNFWCCTNPGDNKFKRAILIKINRNCPSRIRRTRNKLMNAQD
ncbi:hypothetical protein THIOM_004131 [Candidatus Thiomargarita nelsonii]|uniref:Uncharacterized protein n=1 Tax=Candidatus Thiomargarita nelsonii TaxID=1003181 RepID=A0A176RWU1_9GAMM|nr:hypothetical protein THIOM_004131 [Candidatus Thiomargarita nelsonii]